MALKKKTSGRKEYTQDERDNALKRSQEVGVKAAAEELGIAPNYIYRWRTKSLPTKIR